MGPPVAHRASLFFCGARWQQKGLPRLCLALPPRMHTWEQLLAPGVATLPVAGSQLCGPTELLQGQTLGQDIGLNVRACVQLRSKQRERGC